VSVKCLGKEDKIVGVQRDVIKMDYIDKIETGNEQVFHWCFTVKIAD